MALSVSVRKVNEFVIFELSGRWSALEPPLRKQITHLTNACQGVLLIDLAKVSFMDASGLGDLIMMRNLLRQKGWHLILVRPTDRIRKLLEITKLTQAFEIFSDQPTALEMFGTHALC